MRLSVEPDGAFAFVNREGALVTAQLSRPSEAKAGLLRATVSGVDGDIGGVARVNAPRVMAGGDFIAASVDVLRADGARAEALVLASAQDLKAERCELLAIEGGPLPAPRAAAPDKAAPDTAGPDKAGPDKAAAEKAAPAPRRIKSLFVLEGHTEALWGVGG